MRFVIWLLVLFAVAVAAALLLGGNDGLASFYWGGWRLDISLNLFLLLLVLSCFLLVSAIRAVSALIDLPRQARLWRLAQRERSAQQDLREALTELYGARYSRAQKAALKAIQTHSAMFDAQTEAPFMALAHLLAAGSAHRLQDRSLRDAQLQHALAQAERGGAARPLQDGARLLAAEWALEDRQATQALSHLAELAPGVARRTQALRLRLQAARLAQQPLEALRTARLLAKHQAFSKTAAQSLLRSLAFEALDAARDVDQLRQAWQQLDASDRRDPWVAARAAQRAGQLGAADDARGWLRPFFDKPAELQTDERSELALSLVPVLAGCDAQWLQRLEAVHAQYPREPLLAYALGHVLVERQLWGKARLVLDGVAGDASVPASARQRSLLALARLAEQDGDEPRRLRCLEAAVQLL